MSTMIAARLHAFGAACNPTNRGEPTWPLRGEGEFPASYTSLKVAFFCFDSIAAWAAARRATGIR